MASNPRPTGMGLQEGLDQLQDAGQPLSDRPDRARSNDARFAVPCDHTAGHADGDTDPSFNPFERVTRG